MNILRLGDPHVMPSNTDESDALLSLVASKAIEHKIDRIEIEGDLFHTHNIIRLEVLEFWDQWLDRLSDICEVVVLVGNHDQSGDYKGGYSALTIFQRLKKKNLKIIETAQVLGVFGYMPYIHDNAKFVELANGLAEAGATVLVSHTTYEGSKYESGIYCPSGVDPGRIDSRIKHLFSGHIHTEQEFERVLYVGTARWLTNADANRRKGFWVYKHADDGSVIDRCYIDTSAVCVPIIGVEYSENDPNPPLLTPGAKNLVLLRGSSEWVSKAKLELKGKCSISTKITDTKKSRARKSGKSLLEYMTQHCQSPKKDKLIAYMQELKLV